MAANELNLQQNIGKTYEKQEQNVTDFVSSRSSSKQDGKNWVLSIECMDYFTPTPFSWNEQNK